jgi:hypothetical protein
MTTFNTAQAYIGASKRAGGGVAPFAGLGAFGWGGWGGSGGSGDGGATRGAVVDVVIYVGDSSRVFFYDAALAQTLVDRLNSSGFRVLNMDASNLGSFGGGGTIRARVQILNDGYGSAQDAASVVSGAASYVGYNATGFQGTLVSSGTASGQPSPPAQTTSGQTYNQPGVTAAPGITTALSSLWTNLSSSPIALAALVGGGLLLLIAAKK